jgi:hypothetical protein
MGKNLTYYVNKGGAGKSTVSVHTAYVAEEWQIPTMVVSVDPQGDAAQWLTEASISDGGVYHATGCKFVRVLYSPDNVPDLDYPLVILDLPPRNDAASWAVPDAFGVPLDGRLAINDFFTVLPDMKWQRGGPGIHLTLNKATSAGKRFVEMMKTALAGCKGCTVWEPGIEDNHAIKRSSERFQPAWADPWAAKTDGVKHLRAYCEYMLRQLGFRPSDTEETRKGRGR